MKRIGFFLLTLTCGAAVAGPFEDCILANMKGVQSQNAARAIYQACQEKTTPKKCRESELKKALNAELPAAFANLDFAPGYIAEKQRKCVESCAKENLWSRTFGECSTD